MQDERRILSGVTVNGGLRFDGMAEYVQASQISPRLNVVFWRA